MKEEAKNLQLYSPAFRDCAAIPLPYSCKGKNVNPPLSISGIPAGTKSLTLIVHDPDAVGSDFTHWLVWDIPPTTENILANSVPVGAVQGLNGSGKNGFMGPCPPSGTGTHHYQFELYALDTPLSLNPQTDRQALESAMNGHILDKTRLTGLFSAD